jgi:hypothetical protein
MWAWPRSRCGSRWRRRGWTLAKRALDVALGEDRVLVHLDDAGERLAFPVRLTLRLKGRDVAFRLNP